MDIAKAMATGRRALVMDMSGHAKDYCPHAPSASEEDMPFKTHHSRRITPCQPQLKHCFCDRIHQAKSGFPLSSDIIRFGYRITISAVCIGLPDAVYLDLFMAATYWRCDASPLPRQ